MRVNWDDVNARTRGLGTRLLRPQQVARLAEARTLSALAERLRESGYGIPPDAAAPAELELALRRAAAERLELLARWCGPRAHLLAVIFEDEDRRSLRAVIRGAVDGVEPEVRLGGLLPTPTLPSEALEELARAGSLAAMAAQLVAWDHPASGAVLGASQRPGEVDLTRLELAIDRTYARRAAAAARAGDGWLKGYVRETVDLINVATARLLLAEPTELPPEEYFLDGGSRLTQARFAAAARATDVEDAVRLLADAFTGTPWALQIQRWGRDLLQMEDAFLDARLRRQRRAARLDPLGTAPVIGYALGVRVELRNLQRLVWGIALDVPGRLRVSS